MFNYITSAQEIVKRYKEDMEVSTQKMKAIYFQDGGQYLGFIYQHQPFGVGLFKYADGKYD